MYTVHQICLCVCSISESTTVSKKVFFMKVNILENSWRPWLVVHMLVFRPCRYAIFTFVNIFLENSEQFLASLSLTQDSQMYIEILFHFNNTVDEYRFLVRKFYSHGPNTNLLITYRRKVLSMNNS